jgi:hypothetical protein
MKCVMSVDSPTEEKWSMSFKPLILERLCHSRMLLAGIQVEFGLDD